MTIVRDPSTICTRSYTELIGYYLTSCLHESVLLVTKEIANLRRSRVDPFGSCFTTLFRVVTLSITFFALIAFLPITVSTHFLGKVILSFSSLKINNDSLKKIPEHPKDLPDFDNTSLQILIDSCNLLLPESTCELEKMLGYPNDEYRRTLKGIAYQFSQVNEEGLYLLSDELKTNFLKRLVEVQRVCVETWRRVAASIFSELFSDPTNIEQTILLLVKNYKDQIALNFVQNSLGLQWHVVSALRQVIGDDVGLPATSEDREDEYGNSAVPILQNLKFLALYHFLHPYKNGNALVVAITASLNLAPNKKQIVDFLFRELSDPETFLLSEEFVEYCPSSREQIITEKGAVYLLKKYGVLL